MSDARHPARDHAETVRTIAGSVNALGRAGFAASWRRSLLHHKIDPAMRSDHERLDAAAARARREASGVMLSIASPPCWIAWPARPAMRAARFCSRTRAVGAGGTRARWRRGSFPRRQSRTGDRLVRGGAEGTNGIGTCLAEQRPVVVWRDQHFRSTNTGLTCMGAPIFGGAEGELAGVIDVSSVRLDMTEGYARLIALTVQDAAQRIEADLFRASFEGARILSTGRGECAAGCDAAGD